MGKRKLQAVVMGAASRLKTVHNYIRNSMATGTRNPVDVTGSANATDLADATDSSPAATAVFMTTELLERILSFLPMKDLLLDQRVCSKWLNVIEASPELQQNLFFKPREARFQWVESYDEDGDFDGIKPVPKDYPSANPVPYPSGELNPLLFYQNEEQSDLAKNMYESEDVQWFELRQPLPSSPGSWQRMFVSQPPAETWGYYSSCYCPNCRCTCKSDCTWAGENDEEYPESHHITINEMRTRLAEDHKAKDGTLPDDVSLQTVGVLYPDQETLKHHGMI